MSSAATAPSASSRATIGLIQLYVCAFCKIKVILTQIKYLVMTKFFISVHFAVINGRHNYRVAMQIRFHHEISLPNHHH